MQRSTVWRKISILHKKLPHEFSLIQLQDKRYIYLNIGIIECARAQHNHRQRERVHYECVCKYRKVARAPYYFSRVWFFSHLFASLFLLHSFPCCFVVAITKRLFSCSSSAIHNFASMKWLGVKEQDNGREVTKQYHHQKWRATKKKKKCAQIL